MLPFCLRSSKERKYGYAKDSHQWKPNRCYDNVN